VKNLAPIVLMLKEVRTNRVDGGMNKRANKMDKKRDEQSIRIFKRLKEGPATPKELADELKIPPSTVNHALREVLSEKKWGLIKKIKNDKYAIIEYSEDEEIILNEHNRLKRLLLRSPTPEEISSFIKKPPEETRILLFKYIHGYSEPTEMEIEKSANKVCALIRQGMELINPIEIPDIPPKDYCLLNGYFYGVLNAIDRQKDTRPVAPTDEIRSYFEEFPEMKPEIEILEDKDNVWIKPIWPDKALIYISKFPQYGETKWLYCNPELKF
jgi:DNA-binding transcriptional ArsR family regulator